MSGRQDKSLNDACAKGQLRKVREILQKDPDIANKLDWRIGFLGYTPLHEAACQGHHDILQLLLIYGGNVDVKANGNYTPLHIAASMDFVKCIEILLKNGADIKALDDFNKTPYQTAVQHKRRESAKCLKSAEIIQAAGKNQQELRLLLDETPTRDITERCFDDALIEACHRGNFDSACMLLIAGARRIKDSICISIRNGHYRICALLLVCYAALSENVPALEMLLDRSLECYEWLQEFVDQSVPVGTVVENIRESLRNVEDYTSIAIQLPSLGSPVTVLKDLLMNTACRVEQKKVVWSKLSLTRIDESWLQQIKSWVQILYLSNNKLTSLPDTLLDMKMLVNLDLSKNRLKVVPCGLFSLMSLRVLNLSGNSIAELPTEITQWRPVFKSLNVSDNNLSSLPASISRSSLETLNLSKNNFIRVPLDVCEITSLKDLDLSDNREINYLPDEMGKLRNLTHIGLRNLDQITDPPEHVRQNAQDLVGTLRRKLRHCEPYFTMKLMLVGKGSQGKTTLVHRLRDDFTFKENDLTQGVEISDLQIKRGPFSTPYNFKVWDFGGQEDYYATHQCFLSTMSLYLLVWRLIDGEEGVAGLTPWLDNIAVRSPGSTVIIVGTHLDCVSPEKYGCEYVTHMKKLVWELVQKPRYREKVIVPPEAIYAVSCAFGGSRTEISCLRQCIYDTAHSLKKGRISVMGEPVPSSFISLIDRIEKRKAEMRRKKPQQLPIIRKEEFDAMVRENSLQGKRDIQEAMDVRDATIFLRERGVVMHFDDPNEGLCDLYFIDPRWLCALMARVITIKTNADFVKDGFLEIQETKLLFISEDLPFEFYEQYLRLLVRFQIAYLLDSSRVIVPSKLPEKEPEDVTNLQLPYAPVRRVYKIDYQRIHGFWARFMSRFLFYVKEMIAVDATRYQKAENSEHGFFCHFCRSCLCVDGPGAAKFSCFMEAEQWETGGKSTEARRSPSTSSFSSGKSTSQSIPDGPPHGNKGSSNGSTKATPEKITKNDPTKNKQPKFNRSGKERSLRHPSRKDSSKKGSGKKDPSRKDKQKNSMKNGSTKNETAENTSSRKQRSTPKYDAAQASSFHGNNPVMYDGSHDNNDYFQDYLLDPSVKLFSDEQLRDATNGRDHIMINFVDTSIDNNGRSNSLYNERTESVKRNLMNLRISSYNDANATEAVPNMGEGECSSTAEDVPNMTEGNSDTNEGVSNTTDNVPTKNGGNSEEEEPNLVRNEDNPKNNKGNPKKDEDNPQNDEVRPKDNDEPPTSEKKPTGVIIGEGDLLYNIGVLEDVSEASERDESEETGAIKIPNVCSVESCPSEEDTSSLSEVCSLSSWKNSKGIPRSFVENGSLSETYEKMDETFEDKKVDGNFEDKQMDESFDESNIQFATVLDNHDGQEFAISSVHGNGYNRVRLEQLGEKEASCEVSKNFRSQSGSTSPSMQSDEPSDCDTFSESISSVSTTNSNGPPQLPSNTSNSQISEVQQRFCQSKVGEHELSNAISNSSTNSDELRLVDDHPNEKSNTQDEAGMDSQTVFEAQEDIGDRFSKDQLLNSSSHPLPYNDDVGSEFSLSDRSNVENSTLSTAETPTSTAVTQNFKASSTGETDAHISAETKENCTEAGVFADGTLNHGADHAPVVHDIPTEREVTDGQAPDIIDLVNGIRLDVPSEQSDAIGEQAKNVGESVDEQSGSADPETIDTQSESLAVETKKCSLCKENVAVDQLVTIALDVAELIKQKFLHCWRSGVCFSHPEVFLVVAYRPLSDSILVEIAVSPNSLGRRLLTFVVDHLDTLIKEWYPGLLKSCGPVPTVQKLIPCRSCEKEGKRWPHMFTFDSCVTQYSMGNFVKCPEHEVSIQDIAPDVVLHDIDADLLLTEDELEYDRSDASIIGIGGFGKVYRGKCRRMDAAIKEYSAPSTVESAMARYSEVRNEVNVLRRLGQHPFLVSFIGVCLRPFRLVLELAMEGNLAKNLFNPQFLIERIVMYRMLYQVAEALNFLHSLKVIYRDLKPQNILVMSYDEKADVNIKLTDFGTAAFQFNEGLLDLVGSPGYNAPEQLNEFAKRTGYDEKVDVFALGMVICNFITRRRSFFNIKTSAEVNDMVVAGGRPEYGDVIQARIGLAGLTFLMDSCLSYEPNARHNSSTVAEQLRSIPFQLFLGIVALPCPQSVRHVCLVQVKDAKELWVAVDDKVETAVCVYDLHSWCLKKRFAINRLSLDGPSLCLQVNCMHVTATEVLIGLRGDRDVVAIYEIVSYKLKAKITLQEPVFSLGSNDSFIFLGMSSGVCLVTSRTKTALTMEISHSQPVMCVATVGNDYLWLTAGKCIQIFQADENEKTLNFELSAVRFGASSAPFSQIALSQDGTNLWCISKGASIVTAWNVETRQKTLEIDCKSFLPTEENECNCILESAVTCVLPVLDTVWIGTAGGTLLIVDVISGELITSFKLFDNQIVRTLTLVPGPGPCSTEKFYVVVSGRNVQETALSRAKTVKHVCRLNSDVIQPAPDVQITPAKTVEKSRFLKRGTSFSAKKKSPSPSSDVPVTPVDYSKRSVLIFFEALPAEVLRRTEAK